MTGLLASGSLALGPGAAPVLGSHEGTRPILGATAAVLMDARTGRILYAKAAHLRWPPASITKLMTALLVVESLPERALVPISPRATGERSGSAIGLQVGARWNVGDLLHALLMHSANDAAIALAEAVAGSVEEFTDQMNARARALGARTTQFVTPHGRFHPQHYSTAYDLALIARAVLGTKQIAEVVRTTTWDLIRPHQPRRTLINTNKLLWRYPGADGVKTGWIAESGPSLAASASRDGWQLIAVVLNTPQAYADAIALLDHGFGAFTLIRVAERGQVLTTASVSNGTKTLVASMPEEVVAVVKRGAAITSDVRLTRKTAPIARGDVVGTVAFTSDGIEVAWSMLVAQDGVPVRSLWARVVHRWRLWTEARRSPRP